MPMDSLHAPNGFKFIFKFKIQIQMISYGAGLLVCMGPCLRAFHAACIGLAEQPAAVDPWFCPECDSGRMRCFICGQYSAGFEDQSLRKCSLGVCGRFYHIR